MCIFILISKMILSKSCKNISLLTDIWIKKTLIYWIISNDCLFGGCFIVFLNFMLSLLTVIAVNWSCNIAACWRREGVKWRRRYWHRMWCEAFSLKPCVCVFLGHARDYSCHLFKPKTVTASVGTFLLTLPCVVNSFVLVVAPPVGWLPDSTFLPLFPMPCLDPEEFWPSRLQFSLEINSGFNQVFWTNSFQGREAAGMRAVWT